MIRMHVEPVDLTDRALLGEPLRLHRLVVAGLQSIRTERREPNYPCSFAVVDFGNQVPQSALRRQYCRPPISVLVDLHRIRERRTHDPRVANLPTADAHLSKVSLVTRSTIAHHQHRHSRASHDRQQPLNLRVATAASTKPRNRCDVPVRNQFTDLHLRFWPSAATYCSPAATSRLTVAGHRLRTSPEPVLSDRHPIPASSRRSR